LIYQRLLYVSQNANTGLKNRFHKKQLAYQKERKEKINLLIFFNIFKNVNIYLRVYK